MEVRDALPTDKDLAAALDVLASPTRLALLRNLRTPKTLREVRVHVAEEPDDPSRPITRQTVRKHLDRLMGIGAVTTLPAERDYGDTVAYVLNHQALFALSEEFRQLALLRPASEPRGATVAATPHAAGPELTGPCLVLVKGLEEGRTYDLTPPAAGTRAWVIGRRRGLDVSLDFDPFLSTENAVVEWREGTHVLQDLPDSRNGTALNFQPLPKGERRSLRTGDLVGVGRSILMFRA